MTINRFLGCVDVFVVATTTKVNGLCKCVLCDNKNCYCFAEVCLKSQKYGLRVSADVCGFVTKMGANG